MKQSNKIIHRDRPEHWALDYYGKALTPWLEPPRSPQNYIIFNPAFVDFFAKRWLKQFYKVDIHQARGDFRAHLFNYPDKIQSRWQEYTEYMVHYTNSVLQANNPTQPEKEYILKNQKALSYADDFSAIQLQLSSVEHPIIEAAIASGKIKLEKFCKRSTIETGVRRVSDHRWWNSKEEWLQEMKNKDEL